MSNNRSFFAPQISSEQADSAGQIALQCLLKGYEATLNDRQLVAISQQNGPIQTLHELAESMTQVGFEVEPTNVPADLLLSEASSWPLLVEIMIKEKQDDAPTFMVIWNSIGPFVQVFDTENGRRWLQHATLHSLLSDEVIDLSVSQWSDLIRFFQTPLSKRLHDLGLQSAQVTSLIEHVLTNQEAVDLAALDAAARMVQVMVEEKGIRRGADALQLINNLLKTPTYSVIPKRYWSIRSDDSPRQRDAASPEKKENDVLQLHAVRAWRVIKLQKERVPALKEIVEHEIDEVRLGETLDVKESVKQQESDAEDVTSAKQQESDAEDETSRGLSDLKEYLLADGILSPTLLIIFTILAAIGIFFQAVLFRGMMSLIITMSTLPQRITVVLLMAAFVTVVLALNWYLFQLTFLTGLRLNTRLRLALLAIIPNLSSSYFYDASPAEMIDRIHSGRAAEMLPAIANVTLSLFVQYIFTVLGIFWIDGFSGLLAVLMSVILIVGMAGRMQLEDKQLLVLEDRSILSQFYRDAMQGLVAIATHSAQRAVRREYESRLTSWAKHKVDLHVSEMWFWAYDAVITYGLIMLIVIVYAVRVDNPANLLLLAYWCINLDQIGRNNLGFIAIGLVFMSSDLTRYMELLNIPYERELIPVSEKEVPKQANFEKNPHGVAIDIRDVDVRIGEKLLLDNINLTIAAGSHIAIVGTSGAGKSTLMGLLLGWYYPDCGHFLIDNQPLNYEALQQLRRETTWVDPNVRLWNRSLLYNLYYVDNQVPLNVVVEQADLRGILERLEDGLQTSLNSEGRALSGGQGQRVRFGRAMQYEGARFVVLDEAFRGLDRSKRRLLLRRAREFWSNSTLVCVTHDVHQTLEFDRVLVLDKGKIVEDDSPQSLAAQPSSRYLALLDAEENVNDKLWSKHRWRHLWLEAGKLSDKPANRT